MYHFEKPKKREDELVAEISSSSSFVIAYRCSILTKTV